MAVAGFQQTVNAFVDGGMQGDIASGVTSVTLGSKGYIAKEDTIIGHFSFLGATGNTVTSDNKGTGLVAGLVLRNLGLQVFSGIDLKNGWSMTAYKGQQVEVGYNGDLIAKVIGVDADGVADHFPVVGEQVWASETDGSAVCAPASVIAVTGHIKTGFKVTKNNVVTNQELLANQLMCEISTGLGV